VTQATSTAAHLDLVAWADRFGPDRTCAVEDCRHLSRRLEADLLAAGEQIVRVPPKLMAHARDSARTYGKSDPIDALAWPSCRVAGVRALDRPRAGVVPPRVEPGGDLDGPVNARARSEGGRPARPVTATAQLVMHHQPGREAAVPDLPRPASITSSISAAENSLASTPMLTRSGSRSATRDSR